MKYNQLRAGAILSYLNLIIGNIIPFLYTPIMLRLLGQAEYGLYGIAQSIMGYIGLLNFGIGGTIVRYLSKYRAMGDKAREERIIGLFLKIYAVICGLILAVGLFFAAHIQMYGRSLSLEEVETLRFCHPYDDQHGGISPVQHLQLHCDCTGTLCVHKLVGMLSGIAAPALNLALLYCGFGSVGLVLSSTVLNFVTYGIYTVYAVKYLQVRPCFRAGGARAVEGNPPVFLFCISGRCGGYSVLGHR